VAAVESRRSAKRKQEVGGFVQSQGDISGVTMTAGLSGLIIRGQEAGTRIYTKGDRQLVVCSCRM
jgi:hypothetical protein